MRLSHVFFLLAFAFAASPAFALSSVNVMADSSLSVAVTAIARAYARDRGVAVNASYMTSKEQQVQIAEGEAVDILITPMDKWIEDLKTQGLVDIYSETPVARGQLALAGPEASPLTFTIIEGVPVAQLIWQMQGEPEFLVGHPETLAEAAFSKEALRNLGAAADLEPYTVYIKQRDQMYRMVVNRGAYGVFLYSSVLSRPGIKVIGMIPSTAHQPIQYYAVVIAGENMDEARKFIDYLKSSEARRIFSESGYAVN
jgi:molybdate transport system substrate-binding protein